VRHGRSAGDAVLSFGAGLSVDLSSGHAREGGRSQVLGARATDLLRVLALQAGHVVPTDALLRAVWPGQAVDPNNLQVQVRSLRRLLGNDAIVTVRGRGYRLVRLPDPPAQDGLVGREALLAEASGLLDGEGCRLLVLVGPPGVGKTRLARAVASAASTRYADGSAFVPLESEDQPDRLAQALVLALGLQPAAQTPPAEALSFHLKGLRLLLVLDNLEQLVGDLRLLPQLLLDAPGLRILATSQVRLELPGERVLAVPPLAVPAAGSDLVATLASPAMRLLMLRAQTAAAIQWPEGIVSWMAASPTAAADVEPPCPDPVLRQELEALAQISRLLDGLPLALELAASRLRPLSARALLQRLQAPLDLLGQGHGAVPSRRLSLRDTLDWSIGLLDDRQRRLFEGLGVFVDGCTLDAAVAVAGGGDLAGTLDALGVLLAHHLVWREDDESGEPRYHMLRLVRDYARERAVRRQPSAALQRLHADHFTRLAEELQPYWAGSGRRAARRRLDPEAGNLDASLNWLVHEAADASGALRLAAALTWWWYFGGRLLEGRRWQDAALALPGAERAPASRARVMAGAGKLSLYLMQMPQAAALSAQAAELAAAAGDDEAHAWALHQQAIPLSGPQPERSMALHDQAEQRFEAVGQRWGAALARVYSGIAPSLIAGREPEAAHRLQDGQRRLKAMGDDWGASVADHYLGVMALRQGDFDTARRCAAEALRVAEGLGDGFRIATGRHQLARIHAAAGQWEDAARWLRDSAHLHHRQGRGGYANAVLRELAVVVWRQGDARRAARLFGAAEVDRGPMSPQLVPPGDAQAAQDARAAVAARLGRRAWDRLRADGQALSFEKALAPSG
jgi:predicted ATPase